MMLTLPNLPIVAWSSALLLGALFLGQDETPTPGADQAAEAYPNAHLLVTCDWLEEHSADDGVVVVDTRKADEYASGHVSGAVNLATSETFDPKRMGEIGTPEQLARVLGQRGITADTHVVLYDWGKSTDAARVFWTLESYGHTRVSVVDGGFVKWKADEYEVSTKKVEPVGATYEIGELLETLSTREQILGEFEDETCVVLDTRSQREFDAGRIPYAVRIDWIENYTVDSNKSPILLPPAKLRKLYTDRGVTRDKRVHAY